MKIYSPDLIGTTTVTGSVIATLGFTGSLQGTASYSINADSASYTPNAVVTASVSSNIITFTKGNGTTFPITVDTGSGGAAFPYTGSAQITGSFAVTGSSDFKGGDFKVTDQARNGEFDVDAFKVNTQTGAHFTGSFNVTGSVTGNVLGNNTDTYTSSAPVQQVVTLTQAEYNAIGFPNANTLYIISGSTPINYLAFATTGSNTFIGNQIVTGSVTATLGFTGSLLGTASNAVFATGAGAANSAFTASYVETAQTASYYNLGAVTQNAVFSGSVRAKVTALSISSNTASMDCSLGNFFTLQLVSGSNTFINPSNILPGQTINLKVATTGSGTVSFATTVKQVSGSSYVPTTTTSTDIVTFISFDSSNLYLANVKNLI